MNLCRGSVIYPVPCSSARPDLSTFIPACIFLLSALHRLHVTIPWLCDVGAYSGQPRLGKLEGRGQKQGPYILQAHSHMALVVWKHLVSSKYYCWNKR